MSALRGIIYCSSLRASFAVSVRHGGSHAATAVKTAKGPLVSLARLYVLPRYNVSGRNAISYFILWWPRLGQIGYRGSVAIPFQHHYS